MRLAVVLTLTLAASAHAEVELVVDSALDAGAARSAAGKKSAVRVREFDAGAVVDPIAKGRFLSELETSEMVVVVGKEAGGFVAREVEGVPVYFAGQVQAVSGEELKEQGWSGTLPYTAEQVTRIAEAAHWKTLGVMYAPGFDPLLEHVRAAAAASGLKVVTLPVTQARQIPQASQTLLPEVDAVWVLGGPVLLSGAGFDLLVERSLAYRKPLIVPDSTLVGAGAFAGFSPDWRRILARARTLAAAGAPRQRRIEFSQDEAAPVFNEVLQRKWKIEIPKPAP